MDYANRLMAGVVPRAIEKPVICGPIAVTKGIQFSFG